MSTPEERAEWARLAFAHDELMTAGVNRLPVAAWREAVEQNEFRLCAAAPALLADVERLEKELASERRYFTELAEYLQRECTRLGALPGDHMARYLVSELDRLRVERDALRAWVRRAVEAGVALLKECDEDEYGRNRGAVADAADALRSVLSDAPKEEP